MAQYQKSNINSIYEKFLNAVYQALLDANHPVLMQSEFHSLLRKNKPEAASLASIKSALLDEGLIRKVTLKSEGYKDVDRFCIPELAPSPYQYATSLRSKAYLCHASAMNILGLTQQIPKTIYVNKEQSPKKKNDNNLSQESINRAFANQQRRSKYIFKIDGYRIILLSGKSTNNLGTVHDITADIFYTDLERTLIDITVRPRYAGGVFQVLEAYKNALSDIDHNKLYQYLQKIDYTYPYHQAIGFFLDRAGAPPEMQKIFMKPGLKFDFYLDYSMASPDFDQSWRIYFPRGI